MIAMILGCHPNALGGPVAEPEGELIVQIKQQVGMDTCPGTGCLGEPEQEPEQEDVTTIPALTEVRLVVKPIKGITPKMNYTDSVKYCLQMGGEPFIPKTSEDFEMMANFQNESLGEDEYQWVPLHDLETEGQLQWWNGEDAMTEGNELNWARDEFMFANFDHYDCVVHSSYGGGMYLCNKNFYPMVCEMKMNVSDSQKMLLEKIVSLGRVESIEFDN